LHAGSVTHCGNLIVSAVQPEPGAKPSVFDYRRFRDVGMAAGMAWEQSAGVLCAVLAEEGSATDKVLGSLGLLVLSHGVKANTGPLPPSEAIDYLLTPGAGRSSSAADRHERGTLRPSAKAPRI
jgi:hypothetical protein